MERTSKEKDARLMSGSGERVKIAGFVFSISFECSHKKERKFKNEKKGRKTKKKRGETIKPRARVNG